MRIVVDLQGAQTESRTRGIGRYSLSFAHALVCNRGGHEIILALNGMFPDTVDSIRRIFRGLLPRENIVVWEAPGPVCAANASNANRRQRAELVREGFLASLEPDIVHISSLFEGFGDDAVTSIGRLATGVQTSVTLHDLIPLHDPDYFLKPNPQLEAWYFGKLEHLKKADLLLAVSGYSAKDAHDRLGLTAETVPNGCVDIFHPTSLSDQDRQALLDQYGIDRPFILTSGTIDPHKNISGLLKAYALLPQSLREAHRLVVIGKFLDAQKRVLENMCLDAGLMPSDVVITNYVSDADLVRLYNLCALMVFPSYLEGFGLPALEAMSCGAATIASRATSIPEIIGREDALFDPHNEAELCKLMTRVMTDANFRNDLKDYGPRQAQNFTWERAVHRALACMENVLPLPRSKRARSEPGPLQRCIVALATEGPAANDIECLDLAQSLARTFPGLRGRKQLLVDVSELSQHDAQTGCQRVTRSVVLELLKNPPEGYRVEPVYATDAEPGYRYSQAFTSRLLGQPTLGENAPIDFAPGDIFFGLDYQAHVVPAQREFLLGLKRTGIVCRFLVHDVLPVSMPDYFPPGTELGFRNWLSTLALFDGVICVSASTAESLRAWYDEHVPNLDQDFRFDWVHNGADIENSAPTLGMPDDAASVLAQLDQRPSFLMVGTIEPRKGYAQTLAAFEVLWAKGFDANFVIVGKQGWNTANLAAHLDEHPERGRRLFWLAGISDQYLETLYAAADCLIAASEGEGFGLPLIEAARHKLPILARDISVFREVAGEHASYFSGPAPGDLAQAIEDWLSLYQAGRHPRSDDMPWITWKESTRRMLEVFSEQG